MLQSRKPDISKEEWFPVLEAMHYELFICEREEDPSEEVATRRRKRVIEIMTDPRLKDCVLFSDYEGLDQLSYPKLRDLAIKLRLVIQDQWLWGRNWEMVMKCSRKKPRWKSYGGRKRGTPVYIPEAPKVQDLKRMLSKLESFLACGEDPQHSETWALLRIEAESIVKDGRFRGCYWYVRRAMLQDELYLKVSQARETIKLLLRERKTDAKKRPKRGKAADRKK